MQLDETSKKTVKYSALYFFLYCPLGVVCPFIGQYLTHIGFTGTQVGLITSFGTGTAILAGIFWGQVYSNSKHKRWIIGLMCLSAAVLAILSTGTRIFAVYTIIYSGMYFFQGPLHGLCDALILSKKGNFSTIRSFGAVGYALAVFTAGEIAEEMGLKNIFYIYALAYVVTFALIISEQEPPYERPAGEKISGKHLFKNKTYLKLMISVFFVMGTNVANSTYFGYLFREGGGSVAGIGTAFLLMAGSEAPFMALTPMLVRRFTSEKLILFAMVLSSLRFGFYATGPGAAALLATFFLQGAVNGILLVEVVKYFNKIVSPQYSGVAIALFYAFGNSFSVIVCSLLGGIILDMASAKTVYLFFCIYNLIAVFLYISLGLYKEKKNDI